MELLGEKMLHQAAESLAYCPSMELLALGSKDQQVLIYRLNGQRVYGATQKGTALTVDRISWKPNGRVPYPFVYLCFSTMGN
jgi:anaphase-promoting complex subunit 4